MKRILYISHYAGLHGAEKSLLMLLKHINRQQYAPLIILPRKGPLETELKYIGIEYIIMPLERWIYYVDDPIPKFNLTMDRAEAIVKVIEKEDIDIVQTNTSIIAEGGIAAKITGKPHIWHIHEILRDHPRLISPLPFFLTQKFIEIHSDYVITVSDVLKNSMPEIETDRLKTIYNGIELPSTLGHCGSFRKEIGCNENDVLVCSLGNVIPEKGYDTLVKASIKVHQKNSKVFFVVAGGFNQASLVNHLKEICRLNGLEQFFRFIGHRTDISRILNESDIYICSSVSESFSLAIVEAMAMGKPVISTRCGGPEEIIENGDSGILVPIDDIDAIAASIISLSYSSIKRLEMGEKAQKRYRDKFTAERFSNSFENLYSQITSRRPRSPQEEAFADALLQLLTLQPFNKAQEDNKIEALLNSYSWKITAPLRFVYEKLFLNR